MIVRAVGTWLAVGSLALAGVCFEVQAASAGSATAAAQCERLKALHLDRQANPWAAYVQRQCRGGGSLAMTASKGGEARAKGVIFGDSDINLVTGDEIFPAVTQAGSAVVGSDETLVAVYNDTRDALDSFSGMSVSTDGGINFLRLDPNPFLTEFEDDLGNPTLAFDAALSTWLAATPSTDCGAQGIGLMASLTPADSASWAAQTCVHTGTADDRPLLFVENNTAGAGAHPGRRYVAFNDFALNQGALKVAYADGAGAWTVVTVNDGATTFFRNVHLTGAADGRLYLFAMNEGGGSDRPRSNVVFRSADGGVSWTQTAIGSAFNPPGSGLCADSDYFQMLAPNWRQMGWGQGTVGPNGAVHYIYGGQGAAPTTHPDYGDIFYVRSIDGGATWSLPLALNTDGANNVTQWQPSISVTMQNHVLAAWYDLRNTTDGKNYQYFGRLSLDGGTTWQADKPISDRLIPQPSQLDPAKSFCFAGESNFHSTLDNDSLVSWSDGRNAIETDQPPLEEGDPPVEEAQLDVYFKRVPLCPTIGLTPNVLPNAQLTVAYDQSAGATGGVGPYTFTLSGTLPVGLSFEQATGRISGTATTTGISDFSIVAQDSFGCEGDASFSLIVDPAPAANCPAITLAPTTLPAGAQGAPYDQTVVASGGTGPYSYAVTDGALPLGLTLDEDSGQIEGVPQESQNFSFRITATDANGCTGTRAYTQAVACPTITLSPPSQLVDGITGVPFVSQITANGGTAPYKFFLQGGVEAKGTYIAEGGTVFGVLESPGTKQPEIVAIDANGCTSVSRRFRLDSTKCPNGAIFCADSFDLLASDGDEADFTPTEACGTDAKWHTTQACASSGDVGHTPNAHVRWGDPDPDAADLNNPSCANYGTMQGQGMLRSKSFDVARCNAGAVLLDFNYTLGYQDTDLSDRARVIAFADGGTKVVADNGEHAAACAAPDSPGLLNLKPFSGWQHIQLEIEAESTLEIAFVGETDNGDNNTTEGFVVDDVILRCKCPDDFELLPEELPPADVGAGYVVTFETTGGVPPYDYGTLPGNPPPSGLTLNADTGVLSGTPTQPGIFPFTVETFDSNFCSFSRIYNLIVSPPGCPEFAFAPESLPDGIVGSFFAETVTATGGVDPLTYSVTQGVLPPGLSLNPSTGTISGTPTTPEIFEFTIGVVDANACVASFDYSTTIAPQNCPAIGVSPTVLSNADAGTAYNQLLSASGGVTPYQWSLTGGVLPAGLTLDPATGALAGTPTSGGTFAFDVTAQDDNLCPGTRSYNLTVEGCPVIAVAPESIANPVVGTAYNSTFTATGGLEPHTFRVSSGTLPTGLSLSAGSGALTGTPTAAGPFSFVIAAEDERECSGVRSYSVVVGNAPCPTIALAPDAITNEAVVGQAYTQPILASGGVGPYTYTVSSGTLPAGLVLNDNPATVPVEAPGTISGTATAPGVSSFQISANDANGCGGVRNYSLTVTSAGCPEILISPSTLPAGFEGTAYTGSVTAAGGVGPYTYTVASGTLPAGLSLNASTGAITGTPTAGGDFSFQIRAADANGCFGLQAVTLNITSRAIGRIFQDGFESL